MIQTWHIFEGNSCGNVRNQTITDVSSTENVPQCRILSFEESSLESEIKPMTSERSPKI